VPAAADRRPPIAPSRRHPRRVAAGIRELAALPAKGLDLHATREDDDGGAREDDGGEFMQRALELDQAIRIANHYH